MKTINELHRKGPRTVLAILALTFLLVTRAPNVGAQGYTYTTDADFNQGMLMNVNHDSPNNDQLQLSHIKPFPFVYIACSGRGTIVRIDINTGTVLGEYWTSPDGMGRNPSRTTVDRYGNVWVANRDECGLSGNPSQSMGSITRIGLIIGGTRYNLPPSQGGVPTPNGQYVYQPTYSTVVDRNGDNCIRTSCGLGDILPWTNTGGADTHGGVSTADDECIINYTRVIPTGARTLAIDANNDVWVGGTNCDQKPNCSNSGCQNHDHEKIDGVTGQRIPGTYFNRGCGGYGGLIDCSGVLWSSGGDGGNLLRYDPSNPPGTCLSGVGNYGLGIDPNTGHIWHSTMGASDRLYELDANGNWLKDYHQGFTASPTFAQGVCVDGNSHVWVTGNGGSEIAHWAPDPNNPPSSPWRPHVFVGTIAGFVNVTGVAVDANGRIWASDRYANEAKCIDPAAGPLVQIALGVWIPLGGIWKTVPLNPGADPYNYSDMTGFVSIGATRPTGTWTVVHDGGMPGIDWGAISWSENTPQGTAIVVEKRAHDNVLQLPAVPFSQATNGVSFCGTGITGQFIEIRVRLTGPCYDFQTTPILYDLTLQCCTQSGSVSGVKFLDLDGDQLLDSNEPGLPNWPIRLVDSQGFQYSTMTDATGHYSFAPVSTGAASVDEDNTFDWETLGCWTATTPAHQSVVVPSAGAATANFGNRDTCCVPVPDPSALVAWWSMDETQDPAQDIGGSVNNAGAWINNPAPVSGKVAGALRFDGSNYIRVPNQSELNFGTGDFSIDVWVQIPSVSPAPLQITVLDKRKGNAGYAVYLIGGKPGLWLGDGNSTNTLNSNVSVADGAWHHMAFAVDRMNLSRVLVHVDGTLLSTFCPITVTGNSDNNANLRIAGDLASPSHNLVGELDELEIFNKVLTHKEVLSILAGNTHGKCKCVSPPDSLYAWYYFDEAISENKVHDYASDYASGGYSSADNVGIPQPNGFLGSPDGPTPVPGMVAHPLTSGPTGPGALYFDNSGNYFLQVPDQTDLNFGGVRFSVDAWVRGDGGCAPGSIFPIVDKLTGNTGYSFYLEEDINDQAFLILQIDNALFSTSPFTVPTDASWHHVSATVYRFNPLYTADVSLFIDGTQVGPTVSTPTGPNGNTADLLIGKTRLVGSQCGIVIDELELSGTAFTASEIHDIWAAGGAGKCATSSVSPQPAKGDVNGDGSIDVLDVLADVRHILGIDVLTDDAFYRGDCNGDEMINVLDALGIVNVILGFIAECPGSAAKVEIYPETIEFLKTLEPYLSPESFNKFMSLVKSVGVPTEFELSQNYPNPFNPATAISYQLTATGSPVHTTLRVYNILGQEVRTLVDEVKAPGFYTTIWDGKDSDDRQAASGVYFYRLNAGHFSKTRRMVLIK